MSTQSNSLLNEALEAHGQDRWRQFQGVASTIVTGGVLWDIKAANLIHTPRRATSEFHRQRTQVTPFGNPEWTMTWTPGHAEITDAAGATIAGREDGREAFDRSYNAPWDPMNLAYFNGYAMWTYHAVPFVFGEPGYETREIESIAHDGEKLRGLSVCFPEDVHSHAREQRFYFGSDGVLRRHDYEVEVWADTPAAHFLSDYIDVGGLKFPRRRSVFARQADGRPDWDINLVTIDLSDYTLF